MWCDWCGKDQPKQHDQLECWRMYEARMVKEQAEKAKQARRNDNLPDNQELFTCYERQPMPQSKHTIAQLEIAVLEDWWAQPSTHGR